MTESWPEAVPYKPIAGTIRIEGAFRPPFATDMEDGQQRSRRSTTKAIATMSFTLRMERALFAVFKTWVQSSLVDGTLPFTMPILTPAGYAQRTCRFRAPYEPDPGDGRVYRVGLSLDVEDY